MSTTTDRVTINVDERMAHDTLLDLQTLAPQLPESAARETVEGWARQLEQGLQISEPTEGLLERLSHLEPRLEALSGPGMVLAVSRARMVLQGLRLVAEHQHQQLQPEAPVAPQRGQLVVALSVMGQQALRQLWLRHPRPWATQHGAVLDARGQIVVQLLGTETVLLAQILTAAAGTEER